MDASTVSGGWQFSTLMLLPEQPSSWVGILDQRRIGTEQTAIEVGIAHLRAVLPQIGHWVVVLADGCYAVARFVQACRKLGCAALIRLTCSPSSFPNRSPWRMPALSLQPLEGDWLCWCIYSGQRGSVHSYRTI